MSVDRYFSVETGITFNSIAMEKLFIRQDRMGMRSRTALSKSMPVKPIAASPQKLMQVLFGCTSFAPIASPSPMPSCVVLPQPIYDIGSVETQNGEIWSRGLPASCVMMVFLGSVPAINSQITRYGLIGASFEFSSGCHCAIHSSRTALISATTSLVSRLDLMVCFS